MVDTVLKALNDKLKVATVFLDISKAFDTVDHELGFDDIVLNLWHLYNRQQCVRIGKTYSSFCSV